MTLTATATPVHRGPLCEYTPKKEHQWLLILLFDHRILGRDARGADEGRTSTNTRRADSGR